MNHTRIFSQGTEIQIQYQPKLHLKIFSPDNIRLSYFFNNQQKQEEDLISTMCWTIFVINLLLQSTSTLQNNFRQK